MKELDFLPQSFHEAIRRRWRNRRNLLYTLAVVTGLAVVHGLTQSEIRSAEAALNTFHEGAGLRGSQRARLIALQQVKIGLQSKADLLNQLEDDAPIDAVIAEIDRLMESNMALRDVSIRTVSPPEPVTPRTPAAGTSPRVGQETQRGRLEAVLKGVAANDVQVGTFFGRLSSCPLLEEVRLSYSREAQQSGRSMREFELKFAIRRVALAPTSAPESGRPLQHPSGRGAPQA
jgi:hypothetical protein